MLLKALQASQARIMAFLFSILIEVTLLDALIYVVEVEEAGFTSIPRSIYWAFVTLSTVGYGDIAPDRIWTIRCCHCDDFELQHVGSAHWDRYSTFIGYAA